MHRSCTRCLVTLVMNNVEFMVRYLETNTERAQVFCLFAACLDICWQWFMFFDKGLLHAPLHDNCAEVSVASKACGGMCKFSLLAFSFLLFLLLHAVPVASAFHGFVLITPFLCNVFFVQIFTGERCGSFDAVSDRGEIRQGKGKSRLCACVSWKFTMGLLYVGSGGKVAVRLFCLYLEHDSSIIVYWRGTFTGIVWP